MKQGLINHHKQRPYEITEIEAACAGPVLGAQI